MSRKRPKQNNAEDMIARALDTRDRERGLLDGISAQVLPILSRAIKEGWTKEELRQHPQIALLMEARKISIAIFEPDSGKALAASKDIADRVEGKAKERVETTHRYEGLKDEELDALLASEEATLERNEKH